MKVRPMMDEIQGFIVHEPPFTEQVFVYTFEEGVRTIFCGRLISWNSRFCKLETINGCIEIPLVLISRIEVAEDYDKNVCPQSHGQTGCDTDGKSKGK